MPPHSVESPAKKQSKWSPQEDALIIGLRGSGMKWEDISKRLPGRSAISCRLHYQNYLERRSEWDEEKKNKLARLYERFKPEIWSKVAEEMAVPWRAAEAMHWQLGEADMARRAGVVPFSLSNSNLDAPPTATSTQAKLHRHSPSHSQIAVPQHHTSGLRYPGNSVVNAGGPTRNIVARRESTPRSLAPSHSENLSLASIGGPGGGVERVAAPTGQMLPGVAELTTGISPYNMPAYVSAKMGGPYPCPGPMLPALGYGIGETTQYRQMMGGSEGKRRASPEIGPKETTRRRQ